MNRLSALALLLVMALPMTAGCEGKDTANAPTDKLLSYEEMAAEYREKVKRYEFALAPGFTFPSAPPTQPEATQYHAGNGIVYADKYWQCSWQTEFFRSSKDPARAQKALTELNKLFETELMRKYHDLPDGGPWRDVLSKAALGDSAVLRDFHTTGCTEPEFKLS